MRKVPVGLFSLLIAAGFSSCQTEDLKRAEQSPDAVKLVVNWCSSADLDAPLTAMENVLRAAQSETRAADPDMSIGRYQDQWDAFKAAVEPRPYVYDDGRTNVIVVIPPGDFVHDNKQKNVYEWWFLDPTDNLWKMRLDHAARPVILAVDRYWATNWAHSTEVSPARQEALDKDFWIERFNERLTNYRATYIRVQTLSSELERFLRDNELWYETVGTGYQLWQDMTSFLASNVGDGTLVIDDGVAEGTQLNPGFYQDGLGSSEDDLIATYGNLLSSYVLDRLVLEWQQKPVNGFTSMGLQEPPPLHPTVTAPSPPNPPASTVNWTRGVASRGMLFEFFFGAITPTFGELGDPYRPFPVI